MANELTISTDPIESFIAKNRLEGIVYKRFSGAAANGTATVVHAAGDANTRHIVVAISFDTDTANETLAILSGTTSIFHVPCLIPDRYTFEFPHGLECVAGAALSLDKGTVAAIVSGTIWYVPGVRQNQRLDPGPGEGQGS